MNTVVPTEVTKVGGGAEVEMMTGVFHVVIEKAQMMTPVEMVTTIGVAGEFAHDLGRPTGIIALVIGATEIIAMTAKAVNHEMLDARAMRNGVEAVALKVAKPVEMVLHH